MSYKLNATTGLLDLVGSSPSRNPLDTSTCIYFGSGGDTYMCFDGVDTIVLYINGILVQSWTSTPS